MPDYNPSHMTADATPDLPRLYELEAEVMEEVWRHEWPTTVRAVMAALNGRADKERAYTTIMTIMARLARKGVLRRELHGKTYMYVPVVSRERYMELRARAEVGVLVEEYGELALASFAREIAKLDADRAGELERLARKRA
jgi:predicted transcriptional regulator